MSEILKPGLNVVINQHMAGIDTPIYPYTKTSNIKDATGDNLDTIISGLAKLNHGVHLPTPETGDDVSNLRFLRNDNTWQNIQTATTSQKGVVQLSDAVDMLDSTKAATSKAVTYVNTGLQNLSEDVNNNYIKKSQLGVETDGNTLGIPTLDDKGLIPSKYLPSYVDDIVDVYMGEDFLSAIDANTSKEIKPEASKIYTDIITNKIYRWSGSRYVIISDTIAIGETEYTAFDGKRGLEAYNHSIQPHSRPDATNTEPSYNNGYIKINGVETLVYNHPESSSETNPHNTTKADVGLSKVDNMSYEEILAVLDRNMVNEKIGYIPQDSTILASSDNNGVMSAAYAKKLDNCLQTEITAGNPTITDGLVFKIVTQD